MHISRSFISSTNSEKDSSKIAQNEDGIDPSSSTASAAAAAAAELGRIGRLRIGVQSALNHLVYGKWRNYTGRLGKLSSLVDNSNSENATAICWLLGRPYTAEAVAVVDRVQPPAAAAGEGEEEEEIAADYDRMTSSDDFLEDFRSRIWLTYREDFPPLKKLPQKPSTGSHSPQMTTTDCGWGCMLRSAQMLLAQAFLQLRLGRDFRLLDSSASDYRVYTETIRLFEDWPGSPLGLHALLEMARRRAWVPSNGQHWFSASQAILLLRDALLASADGSAQQLAIHVATDNCVVLSELRSAASCNGGSWKVPVLLAIPLRLGTETLNQIYSPHIRLLFKTATFLGMVCGRPKAAAYLVGCLDNLLLSLDPHVVQSYNPLQNEAVEPSAGDGEVECGSAPKKWASFQCLRPSTVPIEELDPSCALGFLIRSEAELQEWTQAMADNGLAQLESQPTKPSAMFSIVEQRPNCWQGNGREKADDEKRGRKSSAKSSSADFELL